MVAFPRDQDDGLGILGLSHRLVALHIAGVALLLLVVLSSVVWVSSEHNKLAKASSEDLVRAGIAAFREEMRTLVGDYSVWDAAYDAVLLDDRKWLYSNIGFSAGEVGTLDIIIFVAPSSGETFGWREGSPEAGESGLVPDNILNDILRQFDEPANEGGVARTILVELDGEPWAFSVAAVSPSDGLRDGASRDDLPRQVHGRRLFGDRLAKIGRSVLVEDLTLAEKPAPGQAQTALVDYTGATIAHVVWDAPRPGASILRRIAVPLGLALLLVTMISGISSRYAVRSARRLERALFDAKAADRSKTEFLSNVSHELRTPMNGILGVAQLLRTTELDDEQRELLTVLFASANTQMSLISDLLDLSRMESGNRSLIEAPFVPESVLKDLADMMRVVATKRRIGFDADWSAVAGLTVLGDSRAFRQIVTNLLGNAMKFTDHGGVEMRADVSRRDGRAHLSIRVTDTGPGIPAEELGNIFERFYQIDGSATRAKEGTGLGLAISQKLAVMAGGRIDVSSELGVGSTFTYSVDLEIAAPARRALDAA